MRLLFVSHVTPALTGPPAAMRAGALLQALAAQHEVTLLLAPRTGEPLAFVPEGLAARCSRIVWPGGGEPLEASEPFDIIHVAGLEALTAAAPWLERSPRRWLDLAPLPSRRARRLARLAREHGRLEDADRHLSAEADTRLAEAAAMAAFTDVLVTWDGDRAALAAREAGPARVHVLSHTLPPPEVSLFPPPTRGDFTLLYTGDLAVEEHVDALQHCCTHILPRVQAGAHRPARLRIVGEGAGPAVQRLAGQAGVELIGAAPDIEAVFRDAHVVVAPLRAGAGQHLPVLEGLASGRPVVLSPLAAEGLALEHAVHATLADGDAPFVTATLRLLHDPALAARVAASGRAYVAAQHAPAQLAAALAGLVE
ncbi:MAG: glycosyltransferase [Thermomicrobiales bacterium]